MLIYNKYIIKNLLWPILFITLALTGIIWLTQSLRFVDLIISKGIEISTFFYLSILLIPSLLTVILPIALFCGVIFVYNKFINDSEITILKNAGLSQLQLAKPALTISFICVIIGYLNSFYFLPNSYRNFKELQYFIKNNFASIFIQEGIFTNPTNDMTVYIDKKTTNGMYQGIFINDNRKGDDIAMIAESARIIQTQNGTKFQLLNGSRQAIDHNGNLSLLYFDDYSLDIYLEAAEKNNRFREPEERFLRELLFPEPNLLDTQIAQIRSEIHQRISLPLTSLALAMIALSMILHGNFSRKGQKKKILYSSIFALLFVITQLFLIEKTSKHISAIILLYFMILSVIFAALFSLSKKNK